MVRRNTNLNPGVDYRYHGPYGRSHRKHAPGRPVTDHPMSAAPAPRPRLDEALQRQFAGLILMDRVINEPEHYHAALLEQEDDELLEKLFEYLSAEDLVEIAEDDHYRPTERGRQAYQNMLHQQQSYLVHFDIFARVDLADGTFADLDQDFLEDSRWNDLRVAVAEYKGVDIYRLIFLAMLAEGKFFENPDWKFDLALGSSFFKELEEVASSQISVGELGYVAEDGARVSGEDVIEDVILQGSSVNKERMERERARQQSLLNEEQEQARRDDDDDGYEDQWMMVPYDPWLPMAAYAGSALFVEALWLSAFW